MAYQPPRGASGMQLPLNPYATAYVAQNGKTYQYGAACVLEHIIQSVPAQVIADTLLEVVMEAPHQGWEGYNPRDLTGVNKLLRDLAICIQDASDCNAHVWAYRGYNAQVARGEIKPQ